MTLALAFGRADVDAFLSELSPRQFDEWREFYRLQPWGPERADLRFGLLAAVMQLLLEHPIGLEPSDFLLSPLDRPDEAERDETGWESTELQLAKLNQLARCWEAADRKRRDS